MRSGGPALPLSRIAPPAIPYLSLERLAVSSHAWRIMKLIYTTLFASALFAQATSAQNWPSFCDTDPSDWVTAAASDIEGTWYVQELRTPNEARVGGSDIVLRPDWDATAPVKAPVLAPGAAAPDGEAPWVAGIDFPDLPSNMEIGVEEGALTLLVPALSVLPVNLEQIDPAAWSPGERIDRLPNGATRLSDEAVGEELGCAADQIPRFRSAGESLGAGVDTRWEVVLAPYALRGEGFLGALWVEQSRLVEETDFTAEGTPEGIVASRWERYDFELQAIPGAAVPAPERTATLGAAPAISIAGGAVVPIQSEASSQAAASAGSADVPGKRRIRMTMTPIGVYR